MSATQDAFDDVLGAVVTDWRPSRVESREAIRRAILAAASDHGGRVSAAWVRQHLPPWVATEQIGALFLRLVRSGHLVHTGRTEANGKAGKARNAAKRSPVYRLARVPSPADVQP